MMTIYYQLVNGERYREMISNFLQELNLHNMWFLQDGVKCHTARLTMDLLRDGELVEHFISSSEPVN